MSTTSARRASSTTDLALIATFAALIGVCAILPAVNGSSPTPFTFQMFGIYLAGMTLGPRRGFLAVALYLAVATAGVPIFARGQAGPGVWVGGTGGYLLAFPLAAALVGLAAILLARRGPSTLTVGLAVTAAIVAVVPVGVLGTIEMARAYDLTLGKAWAIAAGFFLFDAVKGLVAALVAAAVHRAFPQLLRR